MKNLLTILLLALALNISSSVPQATAGPAKVVETHKRHHRHHHHRRHHHHHHHHRKVTVVN